MADDNHANENIDDGDFSDDPAFEAFCEDLWDAAVSASSRLAEEHRDRIPPPEQLLADMLQRSNKIMTPEQQHHALEWAAGIGDEMIRRTEVELSEMRRAAEALRRPRSELLRSRIGLLKPEGK